VEEKPGERSQQKRQADDGSVASTKEPWVAPKLTFVEPRLTKHGDLTKVTGQFFGSFSPSSTPD